MIWLYYLGFSLLLGLAGPILLATKKKARVGLFEKLGFVPARIPAKGKRRRVWFHTVSVGEFNATYGLIQKFKERHPDCELFVSTTTGTGQALANEKVGTLARVFYFPFDLPWATSNWLDKVQPDMVAIAETELWPGFVQECATRNIRLCCVNARISPRSFEKYKPIKFLLGPALARFDAICAQSPSEALRYRALGASTDAVTVTGNMKLDGMQPLSQAQKDQLRQALNLKPDDIVIIGGSTHEGEESALLESLSSLQGASKHGEGSLRLILAPRHPERFQRVYQIVESHGFKARSYCRQEGFDAESDVLVLDTIGQLSQFYSVATIAFVGGTLSRIGGHNFVEPCLYAVPVICGPHIEKTRDLAQALLDRQALIKLNSASELRSALSELISSPKQCRTIGSAGKAYLKNSQGAIQRTMTVLSSVFEPTFGNAAQATPTSPQINPPADIRSR